MNRQARTYQGVAILKFPLGLDALEYLEKQGVGVDESTSAYTALLKRGFDKAYFTKRGELFYLRKRGM